MPTRPRLYRLALPDRVLEFERACDALAAALYWSTVIGRPIALMVGLTSESHDSRAFSRTLRPDLN